MTDVNSIQSLLSFPRELDNILQKKKKKEETS